MTGYAYARRHIFLFLRKYFELRDRLKALFILGEYKIFDKNRYCKQNCHSCCSRSAMVTLKPKAKID